MLATSLIRGEKGVDDQSYVVYMDRDQRVSRIHKLECRFVYQNGGVSHGPLPSSWYVGFFDDIEGAEWIARRSMPRYSIDYCSCTDE